MIHSSVPGRSPAHFLPKFARGPVSRVLSCSRYALQHQRRRGSHSSRPYVAIRLKQPTRAIDAKTHLLWRKASARRPYLALLRVGFTMPPLLPTARCALTAPFHPYPRSFDKLRMSGGGILSVALSLGLGPKAFTRRALPATLVSWSPDFPRYPCG